MDAEMIDRINQLARKSKGPGLTKQEKEEQARLRQEYIQAVRRNLPAGKIIYNLYKPLLFLHIAASLVIKPSDHFSHIIKAFTF